MICLSIHSCQALHSYQARHSYREDRPLWPPEMLARASRWNRTKSTQIDAQLQGGRILARASDFVLSRSENHARERPIATDESHIVDEGTEESHDDFGSEIHRESA